MKGLSSRPAERVAGGCTRQGPGRPGMAHGSACCAAAATSPVHCYGVRGCQAHTEQPPPVLLQRRRRRPQATAAALPDVYGPHASDPAAVAQLLADYAHLCKDKAWNVRQACARAIASVSAIVAAGHAAAVEAEAEVGVATATEAAAAAGGLHGPDAGGPDGDGTAGMADATAAPSSQIVEPQQQEQQQQLQERLQQQQRRLLEQQRYVVEELYLAVLLKSKSQWVVTAAKQQAGGLIGTLLLPGPAAAGGGALPLLPLLLELYCGTASAVGQGSTDLRLACAQALPAVVEKVLLLILLLSSSPSLLLSLALCS